MSERETRPARSETAREDKFHDFPRDRRPETEQRLGRVAVERVGREQRVAPEVGRQAMRDRPTEPDRDR